MLKVTTLERAELALSYLPCRLSREIKGLLGSRSGGLSEIREIRVRCGGLSSLLYKNEALPLLTRVGKEDMEEKVRRLCDGSLYAYRDTVGEIRISVKLCEGRLVQVEIRDRGCGIPDVKRAREPLFTTDAAEERSGMGFTVMESFMDKLSVHSREGVGTLVLLTKYIGRGERG